MTTEQHPQPDHERSAPGPEPDGSDEASADPIMEARELLDAISEMDPADAVEPLTRVTTLLNDALDEVRERI